MKKRIALAAILFFALACLTACGVTNRTDWDPTIRIQSGKAAQMDDTVPAK